MHNKKTLHRVAAAAIVLTLLVPHVAVAMVKKAAEKSAEVGQEQDFVITAYYSPLPDQCCYVRGDYVGDKELNGEGIRGADGTAVYIGMAAAPQSYAFGTQITLDGLGTVTVHDRGSAIQVLDSGAHRLDLWLGSGEEGLARAMAFGVRRVKGIVHAPNSSLNDSLAIDTLPAPPSKIIAYASDDPDLLLSLTPRMGETRASVMFLQQQLKDLGYFAPKANGTYGDATRDALANFLRDMNAGEPSDAVTERSAALLLAALRRRKATPPVAIVRPDSPVKKVAAVQRTLRFIGAYSGPTHGRFDDRLKTAILDFQKSQGIVQSDTEPGAGTIGPKTRERITLLWNRKIVAARADQILALRRVSVFVASQAGGIPRTLSSGDHGGAVRVLQALLVTKSFLTADDVTGIFGDRTRKGVTAYQIAKGILASADDRGAGNVGPATLAALRRDRVMAVYALVREKGWGALGERIAGKTVKVL